MTDSDISLDGQMSDVHKLDRNGTELDSRKLATASDIVNERVDSYINPLKDFESA